MRAIRFHRSVLVAAVALLALAFAPGAFARGHTSVSIGFSGPGYSIGYSDWGRGHGGWGASFYGGGYYGGGYGYGYAPIVDRGYYYRHPSYYPSYYPTYYPSYGYGYDYGYGRSYPRSYYRHDRPVVRRVVHYNDYDRRDDRRHDRDYDRRDSYRNDRDYSRRDRDYGRGGYYDRRN